MKLKELLNSKITLLLLGFFLTGIVGSYLNHQFQKEAWKRKAQHEIAKKQLEQAENVIEETLLLARKRFYSMQKVFWSLESSKTEEAEERWEEYYKVKDDWNIMVDNFRSKLKILVDSELAYDLIDKDDARNYINKESLHAVFVTTHYKLKAFKDYNGSNGEARQKIGKEALDALTELSEYIHNFSDKCYRVYLSKYNLFKKVCN